MIRPILYLTFINDLPTGIKSKLDIFAGDTKMASKVDTVEDEAIVNDDLEALQKWSITNGMKFNVNNIVSFTVEDQTETLITNFMGKKYVKKT